MTARVRFAPSPTGYLHLGVARTALFNWIYARSVGGSLILRVEDTDQERSRPELIQSILELLEWLGVDFDEEPYYQSERFGMYRSAVERLLAEGYGYLCDSDNKEVAGDKLRDGLAVRFRIASEAHSGRDLNKSHEGQADQGGGEDRGYKVEADTISFVDEVRGEVSFSKQDLEDFVIWRSNNTPTFLLANAVDDADMGITHAIRGEDLLSSTPKVLLLFHALGMDAPIYAHLPLLVNEARQKLSKRRDDVSLGDWRDRGYLPEAMANYLALLGWGPPDNEEIRPMSEIVELFKLSDVNQAPAFFDVKKLEHFNATYIRNLEVEEFAARSRPWLDGIIESSEVDGDREDEKLFSAIAPHVQSKIRTLSDIPRFVDWLFLKEPGADVLFHDIDALKSAPNAEGILRRAREVYETIDWDGEAIHQATKELGEEVELSLGKAQMPIRIAITGRKVGPPLFGTMVLLERSEILRRLDMALSVVAG